MRRGATQTGTYRAAAAPPGAFDGPEFGEDAYARAQALTRPDETVLWAGRAAPADVGGEPCSGALPEAAGGAALLAASAAWAALLWTGHGPAAATRPEFLSVTLLACLLLAGTLLTAAPAVRRRAARATLYVVTDRRVLRCVGRRVEPLGDLPRPGGERAPQAER
jgi:hypothetical protein